LFLGQFSAVLDVGNWGNAEALGLLNASLEGLVVDLLVKRGVCPAFCINIVGEHVVTIVYSALSRVCVRASIQVESRNSKVSLECRVGQPTSGVIEVGLLLFQFLFCLNLGRCQLLFVALRSLGSPSAVSTFSFVVINADLLFVCCLDSD
jgi:hypothetical protein